MKGFPALIATIVLCSLISVTRFPVPYSTGGVLDGSCFALNLHMPIDCRNNTTVHSDGDHPDPFLYVAGSKWMQQVWQQQGRSTTEKATTAKVSAGALQFRGKAQRTHL